MKTKKKKDKEKAFTWKFRFGMESESGEPVPRETADQLLDAIIEWVEARGLLIGGSYSVDEEDSRERAVKDSSE